MAPGCAKRRRPSNVGNTLPPIAVVKDPTGKANYITEELHKRYGFSQPARGSKAQLLESDAALVARCRDEAVKWLAGLGFSEMTLPGSPGGSQKTGFAVLMKERRKAATGRHKHAHDFDLSDEPDPSAAARNHKQVMQLAGSSTMNKAPILESLAVETFDDMKDGARKILQRRRNVDPSELGPPASPKPRVSTLKRLPTPTITLGQLSDIEDEERESMSAMPSARWDDASRLSKGLLHQQATLKKEKKSSDASKRGSSTGTGRRLSGGLFVMERSSSCKMSFSARLTMQSEALIQASKYLSTETPMGTEERMRIAFERFREFQSQELHRDALTNVIKHLGLSILPDHITEEILNMCAPYSTLDWGEFTTFIKNYSKREEEHFREVFDKFDDDGSGDMSKEELTKFFVSVGFTPLQDMIDEAMDIADKEGTGTLSYEEMCVVIRHYRQYEGFTRAEVASMEFVFEQYCSVLPADNGIELRLPVERLAETLIDVFGAAHKDIALGLQEAVMGGGKKGGRVLERLELAFDEFLLWARRLREAEIESYRPIFSSYDSDGSGNIDRHELKGLLRSMGLTPLDGLLKHMIDIADKNADNEINFEEFVYLMGMLRRTEGFSEEEVNDFEDIFQRFDEDESGEIDALEIVNVMRYLGFDATLQETHRLVAEVDANDSGAVDLREFLHMMRVWREYEVRSLQNVYEQNVDAAVGLLECTPEIVFHALSQLGHKVDDEDQVVILDLMGSDRSKNGQEYCTLDRFIEIADKTRSFCTDKRIKYAGLKVDQVNQYRRMFDACCRDGTQELSAQELSGVLHMLGCPLRTREEQQQLVRKIAEAKDAARRAGIKERELGKEGRVSWWVFLQLVGWLTDEENYYRFTHEMEVVEETDFNPGQVTRFRLVFEEWAKLEFVRATSRMPKGHRTVTNFSNAGHIGHTLADSHAGVQVTDRVSITGVGIRLGLEGMLLGMQHSLGIILTNNQRIELDKKMREVDRKERQRLISKKSKLLVEPEAVEEQPPPEAAEEEVEAPETPVTASNLSIDFCGYLHVLRWMLNKNFANIKDVLAERLGY